MREAHSGGGASIFDHVVALEGFAEVTVLCPNTPLNMSVKDTPHTKASVLLMDVPLAFMETTRFGKLGWNIRGHSPTHTARRALLRNMEWRDVLAKADLIEIHWKGGYELGLLPEARRLNPSARIVVICIDVASDQDRVRGVGQKRDLGWLYRRTTLGLIRQRERQLINQASMVCVFHESDLAKLRRIGVTIRAEVTPPPIVAEGDEFRPSSGKIVLFVGLMSREVNIEGVKWFLEQVWPKVRASQPEARFVVAGADPPDSLRSESELGFNVIGEFDHLNDIYATARVAVAPLLRGSGTKYKVLEGMVRSIPVVATPIAAAGIAETIGNEVFAAISNDPTIFAARIVALLSDYNDAVETGRRGRDAMLSCYNPKKAGARLQEMYLDLMSNSAAHGNT
jgi:glycosyltransferase involved in cell wall biosynthesis